jgi:hypothetical protein
MDEQADPFLDDPAPTEERIDETELAENVTHLLEQHNPAHVLGALLVVTVGVIRGVEDDASRKNLEWEYLHAYRFWSAVQGQVTPEEIDQPPPLTTATEQDGTIMGYLFRRPTNDNDDPDDQDG